MMASKVTPTPKEEGAKVEGPKEEGGTAKAIGSVVSTCGHFG